MLVCISATLDTPTPTAATSISLQPASCSYALYTATAATNIFATTRYAVARCAPPARARYPLPNIRDHVASKKREITATAETAREIEMIRNSGKKAESSTCCFLSRRPASGESSGAGCLRRECELALLIFSLLTTRRLP